MQRSTGPTPMVIERDGKQLALTINVARVKGLTVAEQSART